MYTHSFETKANLDKDIFKAFVADVKKLFKAAAKKKIFLADGRGTVGTRPIADENEVIFNGMDFSNAGGENGSHETLGISRLGNSDFCKTARKPYDLVVSATLIALKKHFPDSDFSSDGDDKEQEWIDAKDFCQSTLGYGKNFSIDKGDFKQPKKKKATKTYKLWITIEEHTEFPDGSDEYKDVEDATASAGTFRKLKDALGHMDTLNTLCGNDGDI